MGEGEAGLVWRRVSRTDIRLYRRGAVGTTPDRMPYLASVGRRGSQWIVFSAAGGLERIKGGFYRKKQAMAYAVGLAVELELARG